jgi:hypothetical protein
MARPSLKSVIPPVIAVVLLTAVGGGLYKARLYPNPAELTGQETVQAGSALSVTWHVTLPSNGDWIGLLPLGATHFAARVAWQHTSGLDRGTIALFVPPEVDPGLYELRLYARNGTNDIARSRPITITELATVSGNAEEVPAGSAIAASWFVATPSNTDWIGLLPIGSDDVDTRATWSYTTGAERGTIHIPVPQTTRPGQYELRMFMRNGADEVARSGPIQVTAARATFQSTNPIADAQLSHLVPQAQNIAQSLLTTWDRAQAIRHLVREAMPPDTYCAALATEYWSIGRMVGLPLRLVTTSANIENAYDTHTTVEVWLSELGRWAISDPTYDGYWTERGRDEPLGAFDIRDAVRAGKLSGIYWRSSSPSVALPADSYLNPLQLHANVWVLASMPGRDRWVLDSVERGPYEGEGFRLEQSVDLRYVPSDAPMGISIVRSALLDDNLGEPPRYAKSILRSVERDLIHERSIELEFDYAGGAFVTVRGGGRWRVMTSVQTYEMSSNFGVQISPVVEVNGRLTLIVDGSDAGHIEVVVYEADKFPAQNQIVPLSVEK